MTRYRPRRDVRNRRALSGAAFPRARARPCDAAGNEDLVAFSCKQRGFCPSCCAKNAPPCGWNSSGSRYPPRPPPAFRSLARLRCRRPAGPLPGQRPGPLAQGADNLIGTGRADENVATLGISRVRRRLRCLLERPPRNRISARDLHRGPAGGRPVRSSATRQSPACGLPEIVGAPHPPRLRGRSVPLSLRRADACRRVHHPSTHHPKSPRPHRAALRPAETPRAVAADVGGRFLPDPFPDYGPQ